MPKSDRNMPRFVRACGIVIVGAILGSLLLLTDQFRDHRSSAASVPVLFLIGAVPGLVAAMVYGQRWRHRLFFVLPFVVANGGLVLALAIWSNATLIPFRWDIGLFFFAVAAIGLAMIWILSGLMTSRGRSAPKPTSKDDG